MISETHRAFIDFVMWKHNGQFRDNGVPYVVHPWRVALMLSQYGYGNDEVLSALGHDLLEDTKATYDEIVSMVGIDVADAIVLLTKDKDSYPVYFEKIMKNNIARPVKIIDRMDNLSEMSGSRWNYDKKVMYLRKSVKYIYPLAKKEERLENDFLQLLKTLSDELGYNIEL